MSAIQIITDANSAQGNHVFKGTFGLTNAQGQFEFDKALRGIYLLDLLSGPHAPRGTGSLVNAAKFQTLEVSEHALDSLRANLISSLGKRWTQKYEEAEVNMSGISRSAIEAESAMVASTVSNAMEKLGFKDVVPGYCEVKVAFKNVPLSSSEEHYFVQEGRARDLFGRMTVISIENANPVEELHPVDEVKTRSPDRQMQYMHGNATLRIAIYAAEGADKEVVQALLAMPADITDSFLSVNFEGQPTFSQAPIRDEVPAADEPTAAPQVQPGGANIDPAVDASEEAAIDAAFAAKEFLASVPGSAEGEVEAEADIPGGIAPTA